MKSRRQVQIHSELSTGECYHVCNKSIAKFRILKNDIEFQRMLMAIRYFQYQDLPMSLTHFLESSFVQNYGFLAGLRAVVDEQQKRVDVIAYCLMHTHIHLILKQRCDNGISSFMNHVLNSYARYFNVKHNRKGPLWVGRFRRIHVENDEQFLQLTRYIHLNPSTDCLVHRPEEWQYSSYAEYLRVATKEDRFCCFREYIDMSINQYREFVNDRIDYQRELGKIKKFLLEEPSSTA